MEDIQNAGDIRRARNAVFRLLKIRLRSEFEIRDKLEKKNFSDETIRKVIDNLKTVDLINDKTFARAWINSRLKKPFGIRRIQLELKQKGIHKDIIQSELNAIAETNNEEEIIQELAERRYSKYKNLDQQKAQQRIYGFLIRRGFNPQNIMRVIKQLKNANN